MHILGIDIGGSGIKGAPVDTDTGKLLAERHRIDTPIPAKPDAVATIVSELANHFDWSGLVGCGFPAVVQNGVARSASNIDSSWIGTGVVALFEKKTARRVSVINDADAAGIAEMHWGAGRDHKGVVVVITIGTGLGSAVFTKGKLVPNTELGQILLNGRIAERYASGAVRKQEELSWKEWGARFNEYLQRLEFLLWPDLIILGGGASKRLHKFEEYLSVHAKVVAAEMKNQAGIVGAALHAKDMAGEMPV
ncbi:ROK family protein [bacterium]|nr:ROK family protein [bacterium]